jgi:lysophospholipase
MDMFREPDGFTWGHFKNAKGADIRYGHVAPEGEPKGRIVVLPGFRESAEKYFEVANEMVAKGYEIWVMDWRGQGGSERYLKDNPQKAHHEGYDEQIETLHQLTQTIMPKSDKPLFMLGHSMGAHTGMRYLKEHEGVFDSAMLTSPMLDIITAGLPKPLARQMAKFAKAGNYLEKYIPGGSDHNGKRDPFEGNTVTSDPVRFERRNDVIQEHPELKIGDPTYGWIYHTFASIDILKDEAYLKGIKTPILMEVSDNDKIVERSAQDRALTFLPNARKIEIPGAMHEIWMEQDKYRNQWVQKLDEFLEERLKALAPEPKKPSPTAPDGNRKPPAAPPPPRRPRR